MRSAGDGEMPSRAASRCFVFMYFLLPHWAPATWRSRAHAGMRAELPSGKAPTTRVRRQISRLSRSTTRCRPPARARRAPDRQSGRAGRGERGGRAARRPPFRLGCFLVQLYNLLRRGLQSPFSENRSARSFGRA